ncbi:hypothetical protein MPTK1_7g17160 [Marchantia polymorpha subsp. ruderalis]|uniref:Uncharacterized protein n=2 Tax=Marchantia polymorpha TaxID=3197 RepID=A0A176WQ27_MARPO|nr:hypothetical protein AXG93_167s1360 [Marchantia polymorpha subsp. ruderalis]PTQ38450.1 hypothetical protein MARPO_0051s0053 [Marchantia polymorpha]BBN17825.1 hypothetical protein Mp_7g17160 [Marchantia polymorpha subsp. ruderalis]|eukprot:PTQ38450.1 hypothetical protein MARPO_0051s0053 [Marchantia polymorpha]
MNSSPSSTVVDIETAPGGTPAKAATPSFWSRVTKAVNVAEEHIANFFGLNDSKYQWAVDEYMKQQLSGDATVRPKSPRALEDQPEMQPTGLQIMDRNSSKASW